MRKTKSWKFCDNSKIDIGTENMTINDTEIHKLLFSSTLCHVLWAKRRNFMPLIFILFSVYLCWPFLFLSQLSPQTALILHLMILTKGMLKARSWFMTFHKREKWKSKIADFFHIYQIIFIACLVALLTRKKGTEWKSEKCQEYWIKTRRFLP